MHRTCALFLFLGVARFNAELSCTDGMTTCLMPMLGYMLGPEGQEMVAGITDATKFTEDQLTGICRMGRMALKCFADWYDHCAPSMPDWRDFFAKSATLMKGCEQPGIYNKASLLRQCSTTLSQTPGKTNACYNAGMKISMAEMQKLITTPSPLTGRYDLEDMSRQFSSGKILDVVCCYTKFTQTCIGTELADKCGQDAQQVHDDFNQAFLNAYDCSQERLSRCPPQTDPSPEDYEHQFDITQYLAASWLSLK